MDIINEAIEYARGIFAGDGSGHDLDHTLRVFRLATRIAEAEGANVADVQIAALLHDVDDHKLSPETAEEQGRARTFLHSYNVSPERAERILRMIAQVSFSRNTCPPDTLEGRCLQDADRLDAMGAIGIARTFAYGGSKGRRLHDPSGEDKTTSVQHFYDKLLRLEGLMNTETGRKLAKDRHVYMEEFLRRFYAELSGES